ncbi:MAG: hypothetical protein ABIR84_04325 [Candidatus Nitrotoga sp.]
MKLIEKVLLFEYKPCPIPMKFHSTIKKVLFAADRWQKIDHLCDPLVAFDGGAYSVSEAVPQILE